MTLTERYERLKGLREAVQPGIAVTPEYVAYVTALWDDALSLLDDYRKEVERLALESAEDRRIRKLAEKQTDAMIEEVKRQNARCAQLERELAEAREEDA